MRCLEQLILDSSLSLILSFSGYYEVPEKMKADLAKATPEELADFNNHVLPLGITHEKNETNTAETTTYPGQKSKEERDHLILGMCNVKL